MIFFDALFETATAKAMYNFVELYMNGILQGVQRGVVPLRKNNNEESRSAVPTKLCDEKSEALSGVRPELDEFGIE